MTVSLNTFAHVSIICVFIGIFSWNLLDYREGLTDDGDDEDDGEDAGEDDGEDAGKDAGKPKKKLSKKQKAAAKKKAAKDAQNAMGEVEDRT